MSTRSLECGGSKALTVAGRSSVRATEMGALARRMLAVEGCYGSVHAALTNAVYLATDLGDLLWLSTDRRAPHRRYVQVSYRHLEVEPGMPFATGGGVLRIGDDLRIEMTQARCWSPSWRHGGAELTMADACARFRMLVDVARGTSYMTAEGGFLQLVVGSPSGTARPMPSHPFRQQASVAVERMAAACRNADLPGVLEAGREVVGLGLGFTPAGDDYLGGLLFTLRHLDRSFANVDLWDDEGVEEFIAAARPCTGWVSHTLLSDLARGHGSGPLHDLMEGLLGPASGPDLASCASRLCQIGHSSGQDMLAGVLTAGRVTERCTEGTK